MDGKRGNRTDLSVEKWDDMAADQAGKIPVRIRLGSFEIAAG